jgi:hypothetical protein
VEIPWRRRLRGEPLADAPGARGDLSTPHRFTSGDTTTRWTTQGVVKPRSFSLSAFQRTSIR